MILKKTFGIAITIVCFCALSSPIARADDPDLLGSPDVRVTTVSGSGAAGIADGPAGKAEFIEPFGLAYDTGGRLYVSDAAAQRIRVVETNGFTRTLAGSGAVAANGLWVEGGYRDGSGAQARFNRPAGLAIGWDKALYVADTNNHCIRRVAASGNVSTYAGQPGVAGHADGLLRAATFERPTGIASDRSGNLYVADFSGIRVIAPSGTVTTLAGFATAPFGVSVTNTSSGPVLFAVDEQGLIRRMPDGSVERYAAPGAQTLTKELQGEYLLGHPFAVAAFDDHSVAFTDVRSNTVRYLNWFAGALQTLGGVPIENGAASSGGYRDGPGTQARFDVPLGIVVRNKSTLVIADGGNKRIREIARLDRSHDATLGSTFPKTQPGTYNIALVGNSFLWEYTRWATSIPGMLEKALAVTARGPQIRVNPYVFPASTFEVDEQYIDLLARGGAADFYVLNINPGNLSESTDLGEAGYLNYETWRPLLTSTLRKLNQSMSALHARLLVCTTPIGEVISPVETTWPQLLSSEGQLSPNTRLDAELRAAVKDSGVQMLDLWSVFEADVRSPRHQPLFGTSDPHFSYHGRAVVARELANWFKQRQPWHIKERVTKSALTATPQPLVAEPVVTPTLSAAPPPPAGAVQAFRFVLRSPQATPSDPALPQIFEIDLSDQQLSAPGPLSMRVLTSVNVATVFLHAGARAIAVPMTHPGNFEANIMLPRVAAALKGRRYTIRFEAITADGRRTAVDVGIFLKR